MALLWAVILSICNEVRTCTLVNSNISSLISPTWGEGGYQRFLEGDLVAQFPIHTTPHFVTSHEGYLWINRLQCGRKGDADLAAASDVYALNSQGVAC